MGSDHTHKPSEDKLGKGFDRARPVLFGPDNYFLKIDPDSHEFWILHDVPVDLDLEEIQFDQKEKRLIFRTKGGQDFDMGVPVKDHLQPFIAQTQRGTLIYIKDKEIQNMIFLPLRVI